MPNGKPGDHPITDILVHGERVFSERADKAIRELERLMSMRELYEAFDWFRLPPLEEFERQLEALVARRRSEARERGWEIEGEPPT